MKTENIIKLFRKNILELTPYSTTVGEVTVKKIYLNANENPYLPYPNNKICLNVNRYPETEPLELIEKLKKLYKIKNNESDILVTRGSDEVIDILIRALCNPKKDEILICPPTFSMYEVYAKIQDAKVKKIPLDARNNYQLDMKKILSYLQKKTPKIIFIPNPAAPLGHEMKSSDLQILINKCPNSIIVVDEAYIEFSKAKSFTGEIIKNPNLIVMRTLSKAYAMAGLRIGVGIGNPKVINILKGVRAPYALSVQSINTANEALSPKGILHANENIKLILSEKKRVEKEFSKLKIITKIYPTVTNFIFIKVADSEKVIDKLLKSGIIIRAFEDGIRISIGAVEENNKLLKVLKTL